MLKNYIFFKPDKVHSYNPSIQNPKPGGLTTNLRTVCIARLWRGWGEGRKKQKNRAGDVAQIQREHLLLFVSRDLIQPDMVAHVYNPESIIPLRR